MASNNPKTQTKWMKAYGATDIEYVRGDIDSTDDEIMFTLDGHKCGLQVCPFANAVVAWTEYHYDANGDLEAATSFDTMKDFINHINPTRK